MGQEDTRRFGGLLARIVLLALLIGASLEFVAARAGLVASAQGASAQSAAPGEFSLRGDLMVTTADLTYRDGPGLESAVLAILPYGTQGTISDGPVAADGYTWYEFSTDDYGVGWVAGEFLTPMGVEDEAGGFALGSIVIVVLEGLNLRVEPSLSGAILATLPSGTELLIIAGPVLRDGYTWYQVATEDVTQPAGWVAGEFLALP